MKFKEYAAGLLLSQSWILLSAAEDGRPDAVRIIERPTLKTPKIVFIIHEDEYRTKETLPRFAAAEIEEGLGWSCKFRFGEGQHEIPGLEVLETADLIVLSVRRKILPEKQLSQIKDYCRRGKPVVGIRTASHAFAQKGDAPIPQGRAEWREFDQEILGGNYHNHHGNKEPDDPKTVVWIPPGVQDHPILKGIESEEWPTASWLYKVVPLASSATPLLMGRVGERKPFEPVAWIHTGKFGNRVFYTSLGHPDDFKDRRFRRLLTNGIRWAVAAETTTD